MMRVSTRFDENLEEKSRTQISMRLTRLMIRIAYVSTRFFMSGYGKISALWVDKLPISCYARLAHNTLTHLHLDSTLNSPRIPTDSIQITEVDKTRIYI